MKKFSNGQIASALQECEGLPALAARQLGCTVQTIKRRIAKVRALQDFVETKNEELVDLAVFALHRHLVDAAPWAVKFTLSTLGKNRGFTERFEHQLSGPNNAPLDTSLTIQTVIAQINDTPEFQEFARQRVCGQSDVGGNARLLGGNGQSRPLETGPSPDATRPGNSPSHPSESGGNGKRPHTDN